MARPLGRAGGTREGHAKIEAIVFGSQLIRTWSCWQDGKILRPRQEELRDPKGKSIEVGSGGRRARTEMFKRW